MAKSKIEWTEYSWNPITGCDPDDGYQSEACAHCYARRMARRLRGRYGYSKSEPFSVTIQMNDYHTIRNTAREAFKQSGLKYENLSRDNLHRLRNIINSKMKAGKFIKGSLRCHQRPFFQNDCGELYAGIKCKAYYFRDREAVTFNGDGFIAFAGWADNKNIVPIVEGFIEWVREIAGEVNG